MINTSRLIVLIAALLVSSAGWAASIEKVRLWRAPDHTRLVLDLDGPVQHRIFTLANPHRVVVDLPAVRLNADLKRLDFSNTPLTRIRGAQNNKDTYRLVLDLKSRVEPRADTLPPIDNYGHRLVIDLYDRERKAAPAAPVPVEPAATRPRDVIVAIDAGHGGEDPGALGPNGLQEKKVVLAIAKELARLLERTPGFKAVLIRDGDYYVPLRKRTTLARKAGADLFVSIHADAFTDPRARGASVWTLSSNGASSEMGRWLADRENNADLIGGVGGVSLDDKDQVLAKVLLDMSMNASRRDSYEAASRVVKEMDLIARMHKKHVESAGFRVLKSPDMPSMLVETGFISNPYEASRLRDPAYQRQMAKAVFQGIKAHFEDKPPPMTYLAWQRDQRNSSALSYRVARGDTLSVIAARHGVPLEKLKRHNGLKSADVIRVGQVLQIPAS